MRVRWQFYFEYEDLKFEKTYTYVVPISKEHAEAFGLPAQEFEATLTIEADEEKHDRVRQRGIINIFLPGNNKQTKDLAYSLAISLAEHVTFSQARIKLMEVSYQVNCYQKPLKNKQKSEKTVFLGGCELKNCRRKFRLTARLFKG